MTGRCMPECCYFSATFVSASPVVLSIHNYSRVYKRKIFSGTYDPFVKNLCLCRLDAEADCAAALKLIVPNFNADCAGAVACTCGA